MIARVLSQDLRWKIRDRLSQFNLKREVEMPDRASSILRERLLPEIEDLEQLLDRDLSSLAGLNARLATIFQLVTECTCCPCRFAFLAPHLQQYFDFEQHALGWVLCFLSPPNGFRNLYRTRAV